LRFDYYCAGIDEEIKESNRNLIGVKFEKVPRGIGIRRLHGSLHGCRQLGWNRGPVLQAVKVQRRGKSLAEISAPNQFNKLAKFHTVPRLQQRDRIFHKLCQDWLNFEGALPLNYCIY